MPIQLVDTHCHIHSSDYPLEADEVLARARTTGVTRLICVGTDISDSERAVEFVEGREGCSATIGVHPHEASRFFDKKSLPGEASLARLQTLAKKPKVVAVGECGLDYFYNHSPKEAQIAALRAQIELALAHNLPLVFHVRQAFADFWPVIDSYQGVRGVIHSFTDTREQLEEALARGFYVGVNGITTFTKHDWQLEVARAIPHDRLLFETDAPFLTPTPMRGTVNEPARVRRIAEFLAALRQESFDELADASTRNARQLFSI